MGVTELFHFRRFLRRGRRVADGSRHFVIGLDKTASAANSRNAASTGVFPKGNHFIVEFNRGVELSEEDMDTCNNNTGTNNAEYNGCQVSCEISRDRTGPAAVSFGAMPSTESVIFTMMPGASFPVASRQHVPGGNDASNSTSSTVIKTTELKEIRLFRSK